MIEVLLSIISGLLIILGVSVTLIYILIKLALLFKQ